MADTALRTPRIAWLWASVALFFSLAALLAGCGPQSGGPLPTAAAPTLAMETPAARAPTPTAKTLVTQAPFTATPRPAVTRAPPADVPAACVVPGARTYVHREDGYCLAYPARFVEGEFAPGHVGIFGPPLDQSAEPVAAKLSIEVEPVPPNSDLPALVDAFVAQFADLDLPPIERSPALLGGLPAERLDGVPGREGSRDLFGLHGQRLYRLLFMPSIVDFSQAEADVEELFAMVSASFSFLPPGPGPTPTAVPTPVATYPPGPTPTLIAPSLEVYEGWPSYRHATYGFTLRYPGSWTVEENVDPTHTLVGHQVILKPLIDSRVVLSIAFRWADEDRRITRSGLGAGAIMPRGGVRLAGQEASRSVLVCEGSDVTVLYDGGGEIQRGDVVFVLSVDYAVNCQDRISLPQEIQAQADLIVASLAVGAR